MYKFTKIFQVWDHKKFFFIVTILILLYTYTILISSINSNALPSKSLQKRALLPDIDIVNGIFFSSNLTFKGSIFPIENATCLSLPPWSGLPVVGSIKFGIIGKRHIIENIFAIIEKIFWNRFQSYKDEYPFLRIYTYKRMDLYTCLSSM